MLGTKIGSETGKVIGRRILPGDADVRFVRIEVTFEAQLTLLGVPGTDTGTYSIVERGPGQVYGQGQGIFMTADGQSAIWNGHGVARMDENGTMHVAFAIAIQTASEKLAKLNGMLVVGEHHSDMQNNASSELYEWTA